jgi:hypothetical protein
MESPKINGVGIRCFPARSEFQKNLFRGKMKNILCKQGARGSTRTNLQAVHLTRKNGILMRDLLDSVPNLLIFPSVRAARGALLIFPPVQFGGGPCVLFRARGSISVPPEMKNENRGLLARSGASQKFRPPKIP